MRKINILFTLLISAMLLSCASQRQTAYFQNLDASSAEAINRQLAETPEARIAVGDELLVSVSGVFIPFALNESRFFVDVNGDINFPMVGSIYVEGLTKSQAVTRIEQKLQPQMQGNDFFVSLRFSNFRISVLGAVAKPGVFIIDNERVSILEALAMAGDMTISGRGDNILIIRENQGKMEFARLNLNSKEIFASPFFFLQQNDVVYVEPNRTRVRRRL